MSIKNGLVALALGASLVGIGCEKKVEEPAVSVELKETYQLPKECAAPLGVWGNDGIVCRSQGSRYGYGDLYLFNPVWGEGADHHTIIKWEMYKFENTSLK